MTIFLEAVSREKIRTTVTSSADPTGAVPTFAVVVAGTAPTDPDYANGEWVDTYGASGTNKTIAATPTIGDGTATIGITAGVTYDMWVRFTVGSEQPERLFDHLRAT